MSCFSRGLPSVDTSAGLTCGEKDATIRCAAERSVCVARACAHASRSEASVVCRAGAEEVRRELAGTGLA